MTIRYQDSLTTTPRIVAAGETIAPLTVADEYDAAQERGEVATDGRPKTVPDGNGKATAADLGISRKQIHEAREIRDAEKVEPGVVRRAIDEAAARYRITSPVLVGRVRYRAGAEVDYDGVPGTCMQPLNAAGRAAKLAAVLADETASQRTAGLASGAVVPARLGGGHMHRIRLAKSLGAGELANYAAYDAFISNWIAEQQAAQEA